MLIPLQHLDWIIPNSSQSSPSVFNLGIGEDSIGKIDRVEDNIIEIITAKGEPSFVDIGHIQSVHLC